MTWEDASAVGRLRDERIERLLHRIRGEFMEMPGLRLTSSQAARLWAIDQRTSICVLDGLVTSGFLARDRQGSYLRMSRP